MKARYALWLVLLAGCPGLRATTPRNAPGNVDLSTPPPFERGDPQAHEEPSDPGENQLGIAPTVWFMGGVGRTNPGKGTMEVGGAVTLAFGERSYSGNKGALGFPFDSWGATVGWGTGQFTDGKSALGPISVEASRLWFGSQASAGLVFYPTGGTDVGGQVSLRFIMFTLRMRYLQASGFEIFGGYELALPTSITWSR